MNWNEEDEIGPASSNTFGLLSLHDISYLGSQPLFSKVARCEPQLGEIWVSDTPDQSDEDLQPEQMNSSPSSPSRDIPIYLPANFVPRASDEVKNLQLKKNDVEQSKVTKL